MSGIMGRATAAVTSGGGGGGQSLADRLNAARYALAGQGLARSVCKATTEEQVPPKKKHLDYLVQCSHEPNVSVPGLADALVERATAASSWVVALKALVTLQHLLCFGHERVTQYVATSRAVVPSSVAASFADRSAPDMSAFVRRYACYLNAKARACRALGADVTRGASLGLRSQTTTVAAVLRALPVLQQLLDALLAWDAHPRDLTSGPGAPVLTPAFLLLYRDLIRVFAATNDGVIALLERFFSLRTRSHARDALDLYKRFLVRMDRVSEFLRVSQRLCSAAAVTDTRAGGGGGRRRLLLWSHPRPHARALLSPGRT